MLRTFQMPLVESWLLRFSLLCQMELLVSSSQDKNNFSGSVFKLQPNLINARLVLTRGCMANGSHAFRMDPLFWIFTLKNL